MKHTLSVLVENKPGVLTRVTSLFARRGFNIDSLAVGPTEDPTLSRITIVVIAEDTPIEQITKQLHKLINVIKIQDLDPAESSTASSCCSRSTRRPSGVTRSSRSPNVFRAKIIDVGRNSLTIEATGSPTRSRRWRTCSARTASRSSPAPARSRSRAARAGPR